MGQNTGIIDLNLTFEEFEHRAANVPKRPGESLFKLVVLQYLDEDEASYPEFSICRMTKGYFASLDRAEAAMKELTGDDGIYCFKIYELPMNRTVDIYSADVQNIREHLYDRRGNLLDHTTCSAMQEDIDTEYGTFLGKPRADIRFKKGDIVEVIGNDTVRLAILAHDPIDTRWCYDLYRRVKNDTQHRVYMLDVSDDQVAVTDGPEYGNHSHTPLCCIMAAQFQVSDEIRRRYEEYLVMSQTPH